MKMLRVSLFKGQKASLRTKNSDTLDLKSLFISLTLRMPPDKVRVKVTWKDQGRKLSCMSLKKTHYKHYLVTN